MNSLRFHGLVQHINYVLFAVLVSAGVGCAAEPELESASTTELSSLVDDVRDLADANGIGPLAPAPHVRPALVALGRALAFDKELSGNRDISCMTCHPPSFGTTDARHLSIGQGGSGLGPARNHPRGALIPRNAPQLFNLHTAKSLFWDSRIRFFNSNMNNRNKIVTPVGTFKVHSGFGAPFEFGTLSALPLFPVLSREEMRGARGSNELASYDDDAVFAIWSAIMARLGRIPAYVRMFEAAYPGVRFQDMTMAHASNAIAGFIVSEFSFTNTPWDQFLRGDDGAMTDMQLRGARDFLTARCKNCHAGDELSDFKPHNVALAQFGPGTGGGDDFGHFNVSGQSADRYKFRTTLLRNVELSGPYGHAGQFTTLFDFIDHYSESDQKLLHYDVSQIDPALQPTLVKNATAVLATRDPLLDGVVFPPSVVAELTEFMFALTDDAARSIGYTIPSSVPSGLPVRD